MTISEHVTRLRESAPEIVKHNRYLVVPNDAPAYRTSGAWGIYDTRRGLWINFRESELEAYRLLTRLMESQTLDMSVRS